MWSHLDDISTSKVSRDGLAPAELARELDALGPRWSVIDDALSLSLPGPLTRTAPVVAFVGELAAEIDHHPRLVLDRDGMTLAIRTPDATAITVLDLVFAGRLEQWLRASGWPA
jgi:pterin-4a-carbinolamine dehydratase